jgi:hypothetical protein
LTGELSFDVTLFGEGSVESCNGLDDDNDGEVDEGYDADGDGLADCFDACPNDEENDSDADGVCGDVDICDGYDDNSDSDVDGTPDGCDACPNDEFDDADGDGVCGDEDACEGSDDSLDSDADGLADGCDACPNDDENDSDADGVCGDVDICDGYDDLSDSDVDGTPDGCDSCPLDPADDTDGDGICDSDDIEDCDLVDNNGDGAIDEGFDTDADGFSWCSEPIGDCDDTDATVYPGATETWYDGVDSDCSGGSDYDQDLDGYDAMVDQDGDGLVDGSDCDDLDNTIYPGATDTPDDGIDQDCDDESACSDSDVDGVCDVDDVCEGSDDGTDTDADGTPDGCDSTPDGEETCTSTADPTEVCDDVDNDCDGDTDDNLTWVAVTTSIVSGECADGNGDFITSGSWGTNSECGEEWYISCNGEATITATYGVFTEEAGCTSAANPADMTTCGWLTVD